VKNLKLTDLNLKNKENQGSISTESDISFFPIQEQRKRQRTGLFWCILGAMKTRNYGLPYRSMGFLWALARLGGGVMLKGDTIHVRPFSHAIKGPAIVVSNHVSMFDWYFITRALPIQRSTW
jgi:hypothetical protein